MLDPHPSNELGRGILPAQDEARLIARGCTYARRCTYRDERGRERTYYMTCKRNFAQAVSEALHEARNIRRLGRQLGPAISALGVASDTPSASEAAHA